MQQIPHPLSRILDFCMGLNIAGVRHAQLFAEAGHEVPVDVARMLSMAPTLGNGEQLFMLCPI